MIFAQTDYTSPAGMTSWVQCLFYAAALIGALAFAKNQIWPEKKKEQRLPQPFLTKEHQDFVTRIEHEKAVAILDKRISDQHDEAVVGRRNLHTHIEQVKTDVNTQISDMKSEMADIPERTINLLLKTKELNK